MKPAVMGFVLDPSSDRILLSRKRKPDVWAGLWSGIAGHCKHDEAPVAAMSRKAEEEYGLRIAPEEWKLRVIVASQSVALHVFVAYHNVYAARPVEDEQPVVVPRDSNWVREPVVPDLRWIIPLVLDTNVLNVPVVEHR